MATRWGICSAGKISTDFCHCLKYLPDSEHQMVAVAARDKSNAEKFATQFNIPKSYGSYEELAKDPNVDVVYIGTIHTYHVENSLLFINAGKHVLCEKPMALSLEGCQKVLKAAKEKGVLFVEGFWSRHFPVYKWIREQVEAGSIGEPVMVQANFCVTLASERVNNLALGGGALMDVGVYPVQAANFIFKGRPERIVALGCKTETGVDRTSVVQLQYPGNKFAQLAFSIRSAFSDNSLTIRGTKGNIVVPDNLWCPINVKLNNEEKVFPLPEIKADFNFLHSEGFTYEAKCMRECLLKGLKECPIVPHEDSETIMYICTEVMKQLGVQYNCL